MKRSFVQFYIFGLIGIGILIQAACKGPDSTPKTASEAPQATAASDTSLPQHPLPHVHPDLPYIVPNANNIGSPEKPQPEIQDFDYFAWQTFIALNWPSAVDPQTNLPVRDDAYPNGKPDTSKTIGDAGPRAWEGLKTDYELFIEGGLTPSAWSSYDLPNAPCDCGGSAKVLPMIAKGQSLLPGGINQAMGGPLTTQQTIDGKVTYVRYEIRINEPEYNQTVEKKWYLRKNLPSVLDTTKVDFASSRFDPSTGTGHYGAIELKAAWKMLSDSEVKSGRYYVSNSILVDPLTGKCVCTPVPMGLVGFHIAHKSWPFGAWYWATFEQVDNVPCTKAEIDSGCVECGTAPALGYSFNNGNPKDTSANKKGYSPNNAAKPFDPKKPFSKPVQAIRFNEIRGDIIAMNKYVHALPGIKGTVWQNYKLVANQWPTNNIDQVTKKPVPIVVNSDTTSKDAYPGGSGTPFPNESVANVTMETYFQAQQYAPYTNFGTSCVHCHYQAAKYDFSWMMADLAFPRAPGTTNKK